MFRPQADIAVLVAAFVVVAESFAPASVVFCVGFADADRAGLGSSIVVAAVANSQSRKGWSWRMVI
jgi:hypothetical protein